ncbi:F-box protein SKIP23-like [Apium graveolens]|uniref:F-box protein SKIP23-like n=1 Tax=Apium graveolens TaxID=4045 RepID=UPI003D7A126C
MSDMETGKWSDLPNELLEMILTKLSSINIQNFQAVCPPWRNAAKSYTSSSSYTNLHHVPWLLLPKTDQDNYDFRFFSLQDDKVIRRISRPRDLNIPQKFYNSLCLGSSYGWLVMLDEMATPYLFDPFYLTQIQLPDIDTIELFKFSKSDDDGLDIIPYSGSTESLMHFKSVHDLRGYFFSNAVVSSNFYENRGEIYVLMIASFGDAGSQLMFFRSGGYDVWMLLGDYDQTYSDIVCYDDRFYALNAFADKVELWDTTIYTPELDEEFVVPMPPVLAETRSFLENCTSSRTYLVKSCEDDLLLVQRYIGDFVDGDPGEDIYRTLVFEVYKLDFSINEWVQVESLGDQVLFLGGVQSISLSIQDVPACQPNSIYFTDDCWARLHEHNVRYDVGVFHMEDKSIEAFHQCDLGSEPPPIWVDPKVMLESWAWNAKHYVS